MLEVLRSPAPGQRFRCALFDFDGTVSLIREGWQNVMVPYFLEVLLAADPAAEKDEAEREVREFVDALTGKQTIYQCMALCEAVSKRGGRPLTPGAYKAEYLRRLALKTADRKTALASGEKQPEELSVKGSLPFLRRLTDLGVACYLASGTDEADVKNEAALLGADRFFRGGIFGARDDLTDCSKEAVIASLLDSGEIAPASLLGFGDGFVEISLVHEAGGYAVGVATDEKRGGIDEAKRERLIGAGADAIIPDFSESEPLLRLLGLL